uniref:DCL protein n=1 Tax=Quercus lobata TaxID=97700 RepID=A0A7N2KRP7_QUELO
MAAPLLFRAIPLLSLRLHHHRLAASIFAPTRRPWCSAAEPSRSEENLSSADNTTAARKARDSQSSKYHHRWDDAEYRKWKDKENEILSDIEPISSLTKEILHSNSNSMNGSDDFSQRHWRNAVSEQIYRSLSDDEGGIQGCNREALVINPEIDYKFSSLCKLVFENFQGIKADLFYLSTINTRMHLQAFWRSPNINCVVGERLNALNTPSNGNDDGISPRNEETPIELEENSNCSIDDGLQLSKSGKNYPCKICGSNIVDGEKLKIFSHSVRPNEYYHARYLDGERLTAEDEKAVVEKLLAYHPHSEDKIGCGLDSIMVDRHPQFKRSRCLFVVRTDGGWIDFSYQKCLRAYIRDKYPSHSERFIKEHFKRGSG